MTIQILDRDLRILQFYCSCQIYNFHMLVLAASGIRVGLIVDLVMIVISFLGFAMCDPKLTLTSHFFMK